MPAGDCISGPFDRFNDRIGRMYGKAATTSPCGCCCLGFVLMILCSLPFFMEMKHKDFLGKPIRGPTNIKQGISYRTDYAVWSPVVTASAERYKRITDEIPQYRRTHIGSPAYKKVAKGYSMDEDVLNVAAGECGADVESGREDLMYFTLFSRNGEDLCQDDNLRKIWEFEQHLKTADREGYAYVPDFCPLNPHLDYDSQFDDQTKSFHAKVLHKKPCGAYKKAGHPAYHEHPECILKKTDNNLCACTGPCSVDPYFHGPTRPQAKSCEVNHLTATCRDTKSFDSSNTVLQDTQEEAKDSSFTTLNSGAFSYRSSEACALQEPYVLGQLDENNLQRNHTGTDQDGSQLDRAKWCDKFAVVSPFGLLNIIAYSADISVDDQKFFERMLYSNNYTKPTKDDGTGAANKTTALPSMYGTFKDTVLAAFPPRSAFATYLTNAFVHADFVDRRPVQFRPDEITGEDICTSKTCEDTIPMFPMRLSENYTSTDINIYEPAKKAHWQSSCPSDCSQKTFTSTTTTTTTAGVTTTSVPGSGGGGAPITAASMQGLLHSTIGSPDDPSLPGQQDAAICATYTNANDCFNAACQWYSEADASNQVAGGYFGPGLGDICRPCSDDNYNNKYNKVARVPGCDLDADTCACGLALGACTLAYSVSHIHCPQTCFAAGQSSNAFALSFKSCTASPNALDPSVFSGSASSGPSMNTDCKTCSDYMSGTPFVRASLDQDTLTKREDCLINDGNATEAELDAKDCNKELNRIGNPWQMKHCHSLLMVFRLRPVCELAHPSWSRISNNFTAPTTLDREWWVRKTMEEFIENYKDQDYPTDPATPYKALYDAGIEVTMYHPNFLSEEITELLMTELFSLGGTFLLMYVFLATAIGPLMPRRWILSSVVLLQPFLAILLAAGLGQIPIWTVVPGDVDKDGEDDNILSLTILTAFAIHLLLAVVVDYDIILVRAFDRITTKLSFNDRVIAAVGYAHRTISVSMLVGIMAFAFGSIVDLPVVQYFCWHSALGMIGLYIGIFSIFLGAMVILERFAAGSAGKNGSSTVQADASPTVSETPKPLTLESNFKDLVVTDPRDMMFATWLSHPVVAASILCFEFALFGLFFIGQEFFPLTASFEGANYLLPDAKVKLFVDKVDSMGGFPDSVFLWMPSTAIANYHIKEERDYYKSVIDKMRDNVPGATKSGLPALFSWMHEFDAHTRGTKADYNTGVPTSSLAPVHEGCIACPRSFQANYWATDVEIPGTVTDVAPMFTDNSGNLQIERTAGGMGDSIVTFKFKALNTTAAAVPGLNGYTSRSDFEVPNAAGNDWHIQQGYTIAAIWKRKSFANGASGCQELVYTSDPIDATQRFSTIATPAELISILNDRVASPEGYTLKVRRYGDQRFTSATSKLTQFQQCRVNTTGLSSFDKEVGYSGLTFENPLNMPMENEFSIQRDAFWGTPEGKPFFFNQLHAWYEDWNDGSCCEAKFTEGTVFGKTDDMKNQPPVDLYPKIESMRGRLAWDQTNGEVDGLQASIAVFYVKYDVQDADARIKTMNKIEDLLEKERSLYPGRWGTQSDDGKTDDSFISARFFVNADRDEHMVSYLWHHLIWVCGATIVSCMLFMHPFYGLATGVFLGMVLFQIQGLMGLFKINLDIISFAVLVMAMGFAIEYVVHIAHAFLHCSGHGLERTKNALEEMGLTVFSAFLSTAVQQLVLLFAAQSLAFEIYPIVMLLVIIKSGISGFLMVPNFLGVVDKYPPMVLLLVVPMTMMVGFVMMSDN